MALRRILAASIVGGLMLLFGGCGSDDAPTTGDSAAADDAVDDDTPADDAPADDEPADDPPADDAMAEEVNLNFWSFNLSDEKKEIMNEVIGGFEAENPGITVTFEERDTDTHKDALRTAAGTPAEPDMYVMWTGLGLGGEFVNAGVSADLTEYYEEYGWEDRFGAVSLSGVQQYGGFHGVPYTKRGEVVFYRKDLFEQAGITEEPTTLEELNAANDKLVAAGIAPFEFGGTVNWHVMRLVDVLLETACGAETHDALKSLEASWADEPCVTEMFTEFKKYADDYLAEGFMGIDNSEASQLLYGGIAAMSVEGDWFNGEIGTNSDKSLFGIFPFPTGTNRLYGFTEAIYFGTQSEHHAEAAKFMDYMSSDEIQGGVWRGFGSLSVNKNIEPISEDELDQEWAEVFGTAEGLYLNGDQALSLENTTEYSRIHNAVAIGDIDPADAGSEFQAFIDANS